MTTDLLQHAQNLHAWSVTQRRHLHQHPELSLQEQQTAQYCAQVLTELGYTITPSWGFGFTADLTPHPGRERIALRADMDALPIQEQNTHDFVSQHPHIAHMCGHDAHMAIVLTAAKILVERQDQLPGNVRLLFQPSEETAPGGAPGMIAAGCLDGVSEVYGLHNFPNIPVGQIHIRIGALMAACDVFELTVTGRGCHAARPQDGLDPIYALAQLITQWQSIISRRINPTTPAILSVTQLRAGSALNIIPDAAQCGGTIRTFAEADRCLIQDLMQQSLDALTRQGYHCAFTYTRGYDAVVNAAPGVARVVAAARPIIGDTQINSQCEPSAAAEDFAYYLQHRPGAFFFLGSGNASAGITESLHSPRFNLDENCLTFGSAIMAGLVLQR